MTGRPKGSTDRYRRRCGPSVSASPTVREIFEIIYRQRAVMMDVAITAGILPASLSNYKMGYNTPSIMTVEQIADALGYEVKLVKKQEAGDAD